MLSDSSMILKVILHDGVQGVGKRSPHLLKAYGRQLETFVEEAEVKKKILLTKPRYKKFQEHWEGLGSEPASEEFENLLNKAGTANETSDHEARVFVRGNDEVESRKGTRHTAGDGGRSRRNASRRGRSSSNSRTPRPVRARSERQSQRGSRRGEVGGGTGR